MFKELYYWILNIIVKIQKLLLTIIYKISQWNCENMQNWIDNKNEMIEWNYEDLQQWIKKGCCKDIIKKVNKLNISSNKLENIPKEIYKLYQLEELQTTLNLLRLLYA